MALVKFGDLVQARPAARRQFAIDNFVTGLFGEIDDGEIFDSYCHSGIDQRDIPHDPAVLQMQNHHICSFEMLGDNERYLINKIFFSEDPLLIVAGAIGSGKTTLIRFISRLMEDVFLTEKRRPPLVIRIDLLDFRRAEMFQEMDGIRLTELVTKYIINTVASSLISVVPNLEQEVTELWDDICSMPSSDPVVSYLRHELHLRRIKAYDPTGKSFTAIVEARIALLADLRRDDENYLHYLGLRLRHLRAREYDGVRFGVTVIVDNVDCLSTFAQQITRRVVKLFSDAADVRTVFVMRMSTFRMTPTTFSSGIDVAPHCGPSSPEVISSRLQLACRRLTNASERQIDLTVDSRKALLKYVKAVQNTVRSEHDPALKNRGDRLIALLDNLAGFSLRKGLIMAQRLLMNPFVDLSNEATWTSHNLARGVVCGTEGRYAWSERSVIDNIFCLQSGVLLLIKMRMLQVLSVQCRTKNRVSVPLKLSDLVEVMVAFGYSDQIVRHALNEMMSDPKRLIWTDTILHFPDEQTFLAAKNSQVYLSEAGKRYLALAEELTYVQETMLDVKVEAEDFGRDWRFDDPIERVGAVYQFVRSAFRVDEDEMRRFATRASFSDYNERFDETGSHITLRMVRACANAARGILRQADGSSSQRSVRKEELLRNYESLEIEAQLGVRRYWRM